MSNKPAKLYSVLCAAVAAIGPAQAIEPATRSALRELHQSERLIAAAIQVGDLGEMRRQSRDLSRLASLIPAGEKETAKVFCTSAIQNLRNLADDLSYAQQAEKILAAEHDRNIYRQYVGKCEASLGLQPPARPNLRER